MAKQSDDSTGGSKYRKKCPHPEKKKKNSKLKTHRSWNCTNELLRDHSHL